MQQTLDAIKALHDLYEVERSLEKTCAQYGFEYFSIVSLGPVMQTRLKSPTSNLALTHVLASNFPDAIEQACDWEIAQATGPVFSVLRKSSSPLMVRVAKNGADAAGNWLGLSNVLIPLLSSQNDRCVVGFHGKGALPDGETLAKLGLLSAGLFGRFCELRAIERVNMPDLSQREAECLTWTSAGKTSHEIALILQISEHTVNHYITLACRKLNTVNRIQAVALALRLKIIK